MRISDWSSDVCSSDLHAAQRELLDKCMEGNRLGPARSVLDGSAMSLSHRPKRPMMVYSIANLRACLCIIVRTRVVSGNSVPEHVDRGVPRYLNIKKQKKHIKHI